MLLDRLEEAMATAKFKDIFEGEVSYFTECPEISFRSSRKEPISDVSLRVTGSGSLLAALEKYHSVEWLRGDNKSVPDGGCSSLEVWRMFSINLGPFMLLMMHRSFR